jgi:hypothetical protein
MAQTPLPPPRHSRLSRTKATIRTMEVLYQLSYPGGTVPKPLCNAEFGVASTEIL